MSLFTSIIGAVQSVISGVRKVPITTLLTDVIAYVPGIVREVDQLLSMKKDGFDKNEIKDLIDSGLQEFDNLTGNEGFSIIPGMTREAQEKALDGLKVFLQCILYARIGIEGYAPPEVQIDAIDLDELRSNDSGR